VAEVRCINFYVDEIFFEKVHKWMELQHNYFMFIFTTL